MDKDLIHLRFQWYLKCLSFVFLIPFFKNNIAFFWLLLITVDLSQAIMIDLDYIKEEVIKKGLWKKEKEFIWAMVAFVIIYLFAFIINAQVALILLINDILMIGVNFLIDFIKKRR